MATKSELLLQSNTKVVLSISTLYTIFNAGFDLGVNEGPFPERGTFNAFHNLIEGNEFDNNGTRYDIAHEINIAE